MTVYKEWKVKGVWLLYFASTVLSPPALCELSSVLTRMFPLLSILLHESLRSLFSVRFNLMVQYSRDMSCTIYFCTATQKSILCMFHSQDKSESTWSLNDDRDS